MLTISFRALVRLYLPKIVLLWSITFQKFPDFYRHSVMVTLLPMNCVPLYADIEKERRNMYLYLWSKFEVSMITLSEVISRWI